MHRALLLALAVAPAACAAPHEPAAHDATAVRELGCLVVTVSLDDVPDVPDSVSARARFDNRCDRAAALDLSSLVVRGRDAHTHEGRLRRLGSPTNDRFAVARATRVERTLRFDAPVGLRGLESVCVDLAPAVVDEASMPAACFSRVAGRWSPEP